VVLDFDTQNLSRDGVLLVQALNRHPRQRPKSRFSEVDGTTPAWFSCRIDAAEGAEDFSAQAVGWTSAKTAWLIVGPDDAAVRELVTALHQAKG
jgi:hypothetical protein